MPESTVQDAKPGTLLSNAEVGRLMSLIEDQSFAATRALADALQLKEPDGSTPLAEAEQALLKQTRADLEQFFDVVGDGTIQAGEDFSQTRDKEEIRRRVRRRLGLPAVSTIIAAELAAGETARRARRKSSTAYTETVFDG